MFELRAYPFVWQLHYVGGVNCINVLLNIAASRLIKPAFDDSFYVGWKPVLCRFVELVGGEATGPIPYTFCKLSVGRVRPK